jgi:hypothetical protein
MPALSPRCSAIPALMVLLGIWLGEAHARAEEPKQGQPNEAEVILKDSKKSDPESQKEVADCMKQWGPQTQMTKDEWAASCKSTLRYFPEKP